MRTMGRLPALVVVVCACGVALAGQGAPRPVSLLITGGTVVTVDAARRVIANGAVAIDGTDIVGVDTRTRRWSSIAGWRTTSR